MIILDTDVLSSVMRPQPEASVIAWLNEQARTSVWTSAVTVLEVRFGIGLLSAGARKSGLERSLHRLLRELIEDRIAPFDTSAAEEAAVLMATRRRSGRAGEIRDAMIAGIAIARHATLATRNTRHFSDLPVAVVDPWAA